MAYDWPPGWNETRTEKAVQQWVCDTLDVPKYAVRCSIDNDTASKPSVASAQPVVQIFRPLTGKPTTNVHAVFGRLVAFADRTLRVAVPKERTGAHSYRLRRIYVSEGE